MHILNKMLKYDYILIYWLVVVKRTNIFQEHVGLRQLEIKMSLSVIHCMSSDSILEWPAGTSTQQIHSSGVVIEEQLPHSRLINKIHYLHIKQA